MHVLTYDGFTEPFVPKVGFHQGDNISGEAYQPGCILVSTTPPVDPAVYIPHQGHRHVINNLMFSDDRRLCAATKQGMVHQAQVFAWGTRPKVGTVHPGKLLLYSWRVGDTGMLLCTEDVPEFQAVTSTEPPTVVGIPVTHQVMSVTRLQGLLQAARRLKAKVCVESVCIPLSLRAYVMYVLSAVDYIGCGVWVPPQPVHDLHVLTRKYWKKVLGLPPWTRDTYMHQPARCGGPGCPHLPSRLHLRLLQTYMATSHSRNELAMAAAHYLATTASSLSEGASLQEGIQPMGLLLQAVPSSDCPQLEHTAWGDLRACLRSPELVAVTDASIKGCVHACDLVLYAPAVPAMACCALSYRAHDQDPMYPETGARLLMLHVLADWVGVLWLAWDCVSALWRMFTMLPRKETILSTIFRSLSYVLQCITLRELWLLGAQHRVDRHPEWTLGACQFGSVV